MQLKNKMRVQGFEVVALFLLFIIETRYVVKGREISLLNDVELEKQLKLLNKPSFKTIRDEAGDIFDCVDIMRQPAFEHPLLKNHKIKLSPTAQPGQISTTSDEVILRGIGCPEGTIPIRRATKEGLLAAKSLSQSFLTSTGPNLPPGTYRAMIKSETGILNYTGVEGYINLLNPRVESEELTTGQMWIEGGPVDDYNMIQAGWIVSPSLYGDNSTRSFIYWQGQGNKAGCFNQLCPGFVQVNKDLPLGSVLPTKGFDESPQILFPLSIYQDHNSRDWWLVNANNSINYGYWPKELFPHMDGGVHDVAWGGIAMAAPNGDQTSPPMGSGYFPNGQFGRAGYFAHVKVFNATDHRKQDPDRLLLKGQSDSPQCYDAKDYGLQGEAGYTIMYGGPGGKCGK